MGSVYLELFCALIKLRRFIYRCFRRFFLIFACVCLIYSVIAILLDVFGAKDTMFWQQEYKSHWDDYASQAGLGLTEEQLLQRISTSSLMEAKLNSLQLLTLFTAFSDSADDILAQRNTLLNWAHLMPRLMPVLLLTETTMKYSEASHKCKWNTFRLSTMNGSNDASLDDIFDILKANKSSYQSEYYGIAKSKILFDDSLAVTLKFVAQHMAMESKTPVIIFGRQTNVYRTNSINLLSVGDSFFVDLLRANSRLSKVNTVDYVVFSKDLSRDFLSKAIINKDMLDTHSQPGNKEQTGEVNIIDVTETVNALYQLTENERDGEKQRLSLFGRDTDSLINCLINKANFKTIANMEQVRIEIQKVKS